jgi:exopolyphosphatase/guanosine-5'-triphosphate,3'-diphosphate pyrophosphatase
MQQQSILAAVDLGSNSFRLQIARVENDQLYMLDSLREAVRLAGGLTDDKRLDKAAQQRALACLQRFGERLRGSARSVRAVGTNPARRQP